MTHFEQHNQRCQARYGATPTSAPAPSLENYNNWGQLCQDGNGGHVIVNDNPAESNGYGWYYHCPRLRRRLLGSNLQRSARPLLRLGAPYRLVHLRRLSLHGYRAGDL